jgi:endonuclease-3
MKITERYQLFIEYFSKQMPVAKTELHYTNPYELLVAVILSAQCTDKRVNMVTPSLFEKYPEVESLAHAPVDEVFQLIRSISYPNNKAKHLVGMAQKLISEFNGEVPEKVEDLVKLPGVGRKTANVIASVVFNKPAMAVDTHVFRVANRIGLTKGAKNPLQSEKQLVKHLSDDVIPIAHHWLILHGRYTCLARKPLCEKCGITQICSYFQKASKVKPTKTIKVKQSSKKPVSLSKPKSKIK